MAFWALWAVIASFGGLIVSIGGVYLVILSLRQTRQAISNDRMIGEAQVRAYIAVSVITNATTIDAKTRKIRARITIKNTGQSPAYNVRQMSLLFPEHFPLADRQTDFFTPDPKSIERGTTIAANGFIHADVDLEKPLSEKAFESIMNNGEDRLFLGAVVLYEDVFKRQPPHKTQFCACWTLSAKIKKKDGHLSQYEWTLANVHNDAT